MNKGNAHAAVCMYMCAGIGVAWLLCSAKWVRSKQMAKAKSKTWTEAHIRIKTGAKRNIKRRKYLFICIYAGVDIFLYSKFKAQQCAQNGITRVYSQLKYNALCVRYARLDDAIVKQIAMQVCVIEAV